MKRTQVATLLAFLLLGALAACRHQPPEPPPQPPPRATPAPLQPWSWYHLGGILVVEGEVDRPVDLVLEGRTWREKRHCDFGPVRWEMYRPPDDEPAVLKDGHGHILATWDFRKPWQPEPPPKVQPTTSPPPKVPKQPKAAAAPKQTKETTAPIPPPAKLPPAPPQVRVPVPKPTPTPKAAPLPEFHGLVGGLWDGAGEGLNLVRGRPGARRVCLTFDGGSTAEVANEVLDALRQGHIQTTFFLTGTFIKRYPDLVKRIVQDGHEVGNHTMTHPHFAPRFKHDPQWTKARFQRQLLDADLAFHALIKKPMAPLWRAPYGEHTPELRKWAEELGYRHVGWSEGADTLDWATPRQSGLYRGGEAILERLRTRMKQADGDGLVVLMHLGSERPEADRPSRKLVDFLTRAQADGWQFVPASTYIADGGRPRWDSARRLALLETMKGTSR